MKLAIFSLSLLSGITLDATEPDSMTKQDLFIGKQDGYAMYRIPGIVVTSRGSVLAYCEARRTGSSDWDDIDIVMRRSVDSGKTWSPMTKVADVPGPKVKNPVALAQSTKVKADSVTYNNAVCIPDADGSVHMLFCLEYAHCFYQRSDDDGQTWSSPQEITSVFEPFRPGYDWKALATGPAHGIQLTNGRLVVPVWIALGTEGNGHKPSVNATIYSDDHGRTWKPGDVAMKADSIAPNASETVIVQLADGRVMLNARSHSPQHRRAVSISPDGATGWTEPYLDEALLEPVCMGSIVRHKLPADGRPGSILFANPRNLEPVGKNKRRNLSIHLSRDEAKTWPVWKTLEPGNSAYSDLAVLPDGTVLCFYERGGENAPDPKVHDQYAYLTLARFTLGWLDQP